MNEEQNEEERRKCNRCKVALLVSNYSVKRDKVLLKTCNRCREKMKCEHNRHKSKCKECGTGTAFCQHGRQKAQCKDCGDPIKITIKNIISQSRKSDKDKNRYDADRFIDKCFMTGLTEDYHNCYYCKVKMQYINYSDDLATIVRLDNSLGHIKSNCVLACRKCNYSKVGDSRKK